MDTTEAEFQISSLTWNIESIQSSIFFLNDVLSKHLPDLVFLSEPQCFQSDILTVMDYVKGEYKFHLNSEDINDLDLPFTSSRAKGGTLLMWRKHLDPYVTIHPTSSASFVPLVLSMPHHPVSAHFAIYLPTHGQDDRFVHDLAELRLCIDELSSKYSDLLIFIRGDGNVNVKNKKRVTFLKQFMSDLNLSSAMINHRTYHHFVGDGLYDSNIDMILYPASLRNKETVTEIYCQKLFPEMNSHHDILLSSCSLPFCHDVSKNDINLITAPRVEMPLRKIIWSANGVEKYQDYVAPKLKPLRDRWLKSNSYYSIAVLIKMTNFILDQAASNTNISHDLRESVNVRSKKIPASIISAKRRLRRLQSKPQNLTQESKLRQAKHAYRAEIRKAKIQSCYQRDKKIFEILRTDPSAAFKYINSYKKTQTCKIESLNVNGKIYETDRVADGFFDAMSSLKSADIQEFHDDPQLALHLSNYDIIRSLCSQAKQVPLADIDTTTKILKRLKKDVRDIHNITALHFLNAGNEGLVHFNAVINAILTSVNNASIDELNLVLGIILYKGHNKDKTSSRSYRTISTCSVIAKAIDIYLRDLYHQLWDVQQAPTQYQGSGSNHELAALLVTEVIQHSIFTAKKPVYMLLLDAESAFDRCLRQILCAELFKAGVNDQALLLIDNRLANRSTVYKWETSLCGPSSDVTGFEQGGVNSSDWYKLYNNEQLIVSQNSKLGVNIVSSIVSAVGQADDVALFSNTISNLYLLLAITLQYCRKNRVKLVPNKTKLLAFHGPNNAYEKDIAELVNPIQIDGIPVPFSVEAEHVGILRHTDGNKPNIMKRIMAHKKSLHALLSTGISRGHRGNPGASLRVHAIYNTPVLLSGLPALVLSKEEVRLIDNHFLVTLQNLQRLHEKTPRAVTLFLAGSLPGEALLHLRQLSLFSMITRLIGDPLNDHAHYVLTCSTRSSKSWFLQVRDICLKYALPHPLQLLQYPLSKNQFRLLAKKHVIKFWEDQLHHEIRSLSSLCFFNPQNCSLQKTSTMWLSAGSNSFENSKALIVARMLSGRFRSEYLARHWTPTNRQGYCLENTCTGIIGDLKHILITCPSMAHTRYRLINFWIEKTVTCGILGPIFLRLVYSEADEITQFILDPLSNDIIRGICQNGHETIIQKVFYLTRTFAYYMIRAKRKLKRDNVLETP